MPDPNLQGKTLSLMKKRNEFGWLEGLMRQAFLLFPTSIICMVRHISLALLTNKDFIGMGYVIHPNVEEQPNCLYDRTDGSIDGNDTIARGLHQAIEAREKVSSLETRAMACHCLQNLFKMFRKLGGMTGTESRWNGDSRYLSVIKNSRPQPKNHRDLPDKDLSDPAWKSVCASLGIYQEVHANSSQS